MRILTKEKQNKNELEQEEFGLELNPEDLEVSEENEQKKEQINKPNKEKK